MNGDLGKTLIILGCLLAAAGVIVTIFAKTGIHLGKLPGDINIKKENFSFHFPIVTSVIISIIITVLLNLFFRK